jgi:hypothetical protein
MGMPQRSYDICYSVLRHLLCFQIPASFKHQLATNAVTNRIGKPYSHTGCQNRRPVFKPKICNSRHGNCTATKAYTRKLARLRFQASFQRPWLIAINDRVNPQPGQSIPNIIRELHIDGKGRSMPGKMTLVFPSEFMVNDNNITTAATTKNVQCMAISDRSTGDDFSYGRDDWVFNALVVFAWCCALILKFPQPN